MYCSIWTGVTWQHEDLVLLNVEFLTFRCTSFSPLFTWISESRSLKSKFCSSTNLIDVRLFRRKNFHRKPGQCFLSLWTAIFILNHNLSDCIHCESAFLIPQNGLEVNPTAHMLHCQFSTLGCNIFFLKDYSMAWEGKVYWLIILNLACYQLCTNWI